MGKIAWGCLPPAEQEAYRQFEGAFAGYALQVDTSRLDPAVDLMGVVRAVLGDNPQIIYFDRTALAQRRSLLGGRQRAVLMGVPPLGEISRMNQRLEDALCRAVEEIRALNPMTDYDTLISIYEYIQDHVAYDTQERDQAARTGQPGDYQSFSAYGALVNGRAVCDGMSAGLALIAQRMGYDCTVVAGKALVDTTLPTEHAWNILRLPEGGFCHMDVTWDAGQRRSAGAYDYRYFCVSDETMGTDHQWDVARMPVCANESLSYYKRNRCFANNLTQAEEILARLAKSRQGVARLRLREGIPVPEPQERYMLGLFAKAAQGAGKSGRISGRWDPRSRCFFGRIEPAG